MTNSLSSIRASFLSYFEKNGHAVLPSSSLVPHNDPTLMFANAGMNQFKDIFTGNEKPKAPRATTSQKCVRAGGKHNDLDNVGYTARHHTFFEMLGNFSFGDYFKEEAITLAWELLTKEWGIAAEKLCVTVYHDDDFAWNTWKKITGFADHKIIRIPTADNFWAMGDTGPCGPCSEIFYDHGEHIKGGPPGSAEQDGDRFTEVWNLVFMQYEQKDAQTRVNLPKPSIDTGMGLERIAAVLQGVHDNYEIDLFKALIRDIQERIADSGLRIGSPTANRQRLPAHKVIADHLRSSCFLMADGVMPSNEGRGYVLRRIMRRAMRYAHQLGCVEPLMYKLVPALVAEMGAHYPELSRAQATITENLRAEEERFKETLGRGLKLLEEELTPNTKTFSGETAFKLYDTYGFPLDLTQDILRGKNIDVDVAAFDACMENQREMARASHKGSGDAATGKIWFEIKEKVGATKFLGYDQNECEATVLAIVKDGVMVESATKDERVQVILDATTFYGESGGQVGDAGSFVWIESGKTLDDDDANFEVIAIVNDTQKPLDDFFVHTVNVTKNIKLGDAFWTVVEKPRRDAIRSNHSATHLLHKALRDLLGEHVTQKGSLVNDEKLRFDFSHGKAVSKEEIAAIELVVNQVVARGGAVKCEEMAPDAAIAAGAMALFGEKYGETVRVLSMGTNPQSPTPNPYSVELCGGTHVRNVADIGAFKIVSEGSVASGVRRIEAVTGEAVSVYLEQEKEKQRAQADAEEARKRAKEEADAKKQAALADSKVTVETVGVVKFIGKAFDGLDPKDLREVANGYLKQADVVAVATVVEGKASVVVGVNKTHTETLSAVTLVQKAVEILGGKGGGGKPDMAQGGGPEAGNISDALRAIKNSL